MDKEFINEINKILNKKEIDERLKPLIKLYFLGKLKLNESTIEQLENQINNLCSSIHNVEFSSNNIVSAYSDKSGVLTINKKLFLEGKSDEVILPVFMKFESALNQNNRRDYANYIEDFIRAGRIAKSNSVPMSDRLYKLYEMAEYSYGDIEHKTHELSQDNNWKVTCSKYNESLNKMIITGKDYPRELLDGVRLFHYEIFTSEAFQNPDFEGPFKNEEYQKKSAKILGYIDNFKSEMDETEKEGLTKNIKLFTGCTQEMIEESKTTTYNADSRISNVLETTMQQNTIKISEEFIVSKVQDMLDRKPDWDNRIKHLIIPFFIRSQKIYDWDIDEFNERLNQLDLKIDKIVFKDLESITNLGSTALDTIKLNSRIFFDRKGRPSYPVTKTLFHELGHVTDENFRESITSKEPLQNAALGSGRFYEYTNTIFERLAGGGKFYKKDDAMQLSPSGYEALAPLGSMLACALGISEIEFAKIKDKGKDYEEHLLEEIFPSTDDTESPHGSEVLRKAKKIFDTYELDTDFSLSKKMTNQKLLNEMYEECLGIMQKRIEIELQRGNIKNPEEYKKHQMFFLKKMNFNFKAASKSDGFRFSKTPIIHDIGFCTDNLSKKDLEKISNEQVSIVDFGFDNSTLGKYSKAMIASAKDKKSFRKSIEVQDIEMSEPNQTETIITTSEQVKIEDKEEAIEEDKDF